MPRKKASVEIRLRNFNIPYSLKDLQQSLKNAGEYSILAKATHFDKVSYILDLLYNNTIYDRTATKDSYKTLNSRTLSSIMGRPYDRLVMEFLIVHDIIETDGSYQVGVESKGYRLTEKYRNDRAVCVYNQDSKFVLKMTQRSWEKLNDTERFLFNQLRTVTIRYQESLLYLFYAFDLLYLLCTIKCTEENNLGFNEVMSALDEVADEKLRDQVRDKFISIHKIQTGQFFFVRDDTGERVHTNITNLWGEFRQFISLDGCEDLTNIDLKNSQLLFSCISLRNYYNELSQDMPADVKRWMQVCQSGNAYEQIHKIFHGTELDQSCRGEFKGEFFGKLFYCEIRHMNSKEAVAFKKELPSVYNFIVHMKKKNYRNFSVQMQLLESQLVIRQLCHWLYQELIPVLSIHDSCLVRAEDALIVENKFNEFLKTLRIKAKIKLEHMTTASERIYKAAKQQPSESRPTIERKDRATILEETRATLAALEEATMKHPELQVRVDQRRPMESKKDAITKAFDDFLLEAANW